MAKDVAASSPRPTAVIAFTDYTAAGLIAGLIDLGLRVPDDVSVLAVGEQPFDRMLRPALSTLAPQFEKMGELATRTLLAMIDGQAGESAAVPPSLIMRDTVRQI
jgi:LacI family transcriptional regulator